MVLLNSKMVTTSLYSTPPTPPPKNERKSRISAVSYIEYVIAFVIIYK